MPERVLQPTWGPIGSKLERADPAEYEHVRQMHEDLLANEQARNSVTEAQKPSRVTDFAPESVTRTCSGCGSPFQPARPNHHYCTNACRQANYRRRGAA